MKKKRKIDIDTYLRTKKYSTLANKIRYQKLLPKLMFISY